LEISFGKWVSGPAASPENSFMAPDSPVAQITLGPSSNWTRWQQYLVREQMGMFADQEPVEDL
jgi:hypothetical protein